MFEALQQTLLNLNPQYATVAAVVTVAAVFVASKILSGDDVDTRSELLTPTKKDKWYKVPLKEIVQISHDTRLFRFGLRNPNQTLGLPTGQHVSLRAVVGGKPINRSYTPVTSEDDKGHFDLVVKVYFANVHPRFPEGGKMTQELERMHIGDTIEVSGPKGTFDYEGRGVFTCRKGESFSVKNFAMVAGGTGITPIMQVLHQILKDPEDHTQCWLLFANQTEDDILLRPELEAMVARSKGQLRLWYTLDRPPASGWKFDSGFVTEEMLRAHMPAAGPETFALMCGPPPMVNNALKPNFEKIGYEKNHMFSF